MSGANTPPFRSGDRVRWVMSTIIGLPEGFETEIIRVYDGGDDRWRVVVADVDGDIRNRDAAEFQLVRPVPASPEPESVPAHPPISTWGMWS